jgi:PilZ domain
MRAAILGRFTVAVRRVYGPQGGTRAEPRIPVDLSAVLTSPSYDRMFARVVDMSQSGLGFELPDSVAVGTRVSVHFASGIAFGEIKHCTAKPAEGGKPLERMQVGTLRSINRGKDRTRFRLTRTNDCLWLPPYRATANRIRCDRSRFPTPTSCRGKCCKVRAGTILAPAQCAYMLQARPIQPGGFLTCFPCEESHGCDR